MECINEILAHKSIGRLKFISKKNLIQEFGNIQLSTWSLVFQ